VRSGESNEGEVAAQNRSGRLDHAAFILEQQEIGHTLLEIADMIAARWETLDKLPRKHETPTPGASGEVGNVDYRPQAGGDVADIGLVAVTLGKRASCRVLIA
jgi:hypothetical protein